MQPIALAPPDLADGGAPLLPSAVPSRLRACQTALDHIALPDEERQRAADLLAHLLALHEAGRLTPAFLALALRSLQGLDALQPQLHPLLQAAQARARAGGHRDFQGHTGSPWLPSGYGRLR